MSRESEEQETEGGEALEGWIVGRLKEGREKEYEKDERKWGGGWGEGVVEMALGHHMVQMGRQVP